MIGDTQKPDSVFSELGFSESIDSIIKKIIDLYKMDDIPWVIGYSGGKDSTAVLQLVWMALLKLENPTKPVYVISTDTLVENPIVVLWVNNSLEAMKKSAAEHKLPIFPHRLTPTLGDSYWVNLIGRGYPAPRPKFRWCTVRLKINPSNNFINEVVSKHGEAILVLGTRKAESKSRAKSMNHFESKRLREHLSPATNLPNCLVFTPIEDWSNDDVWMFLMQHPNPWGYNNRDLLTMYQGASPDGECPLVVDTTTPSCGASRFGCWVCTLVSQDRSMTAMIQNDEEKEWMLPLLEFRNKLAPPDRYLRDFRRMSGAVQLFNGKPIPGPYIQSARIGWLRELLEIQTWLQNNKPHNVPEIELISIDELEEIRRFWVFEKHEFEDVLPKIYEESTGTPYPCGVLDEGRAFGAKELKLLEDICGENLLHFELIRELLDVERQFRTMSRRAGLFEAIEKAFRKSFYDDKEDATNRALKKEEELLRALGQNDIRKQLSLFDIKDKGKEIKVKK